MIDDESQVACPITTKLVLDQDENTKEPLIQVHRNLVTRLKPHQVDGQSVGLSSHHTRTSDDYRLCVYCCAVVSWTGVQFIWDCCCESVRKANTTPGSGCLLAHCMGLGKTLQVTERYRL